MKKTTLFTLLIATIGGLIFLQACGPDDPPIDPPVDSEEFIADNSTFAGWQNWTLADTNTGPDPALGSAHHGNDSTVTRSIYFKDDAMRVDSMFPVGTVIVKHSSNDSTVNEYTGMVKRGNDFNPNYGNWEFFVLDENSEIISRGGTDLMGGACTGCHSQADNNDYVFTD
ncbi:cytochrome P460 family protein [bacterium]|nr:cytochrome P460 family protein [bacterium]